LLSRPLTLFAHLCFLYFFVALLATLDFVASADEFITRTLRVSSGAEHLLVAS
jgi:hypothetical protein